MERNTLNLSLKLAEFTVGFHLDSAPAKAVENAKLAILDCLGVAVLATTQEIGTILFNFARNNIGIGPCTIWGTALKTTPRDAALINGTLAHGLDYDDRNHSSTYTLAASFAAAEARDRSGAKMIEGFIAGREVRSALDGLFSKRSSGIGPGARGWHSNGILGPIAAACSVSKILELNIEQTKVAIGLAAGSCRAMTRDGGTMAKPFRVGQAAASSHFSQRDHIEGCKRRECFHLDDPGGSALLSRRQTGNWTPMAAIRLCTSQCPIRRRRYSLVADSADNPQISAA